MSDAFGYFMLLSLLALPVVLIRHTTFGLKRSRAALITLSCFVVGFIGLGATAERQEKPGEAPAASTQTLVGAPAPAVPPNPPAPARAPVATPAAPAKPARQPGEPYTLTAPNNGTVFVWRDSNAMSEGYRLIQANVHRTQPQLVGRLLTCSVPSGTKAVVTDGGIFSSTVLIVDGPRTGCRGVIPNEDLPR